jgi:hypothetical protein
LRAGAVNQSIIAENPTNFKYGPKNSAALLKNILQKQAFLRLTWAGEYDILTNGNRISAVDSRCRAKALLNILPR